MCHVSPPKIRSYTTPLPIPRYVILNVTQGFLCSYFKINFDLFPVTHTYVYGFYLLCCHFICDLGITDKVQKCQKSRNHPVTITCQNDRFYTAHQHYRVIRHLKSYLSLTSKHKLCFSLKLLKLYTKMSLLIFKSIMQKVTLTLTDTASIGSAWFPSVETSALILTSGSAWHVIVGVLQNNEQSGNKTKRHAPTASWTGPLWQPCPNSGNLSTDPD